MWDLLGIVALCAVAWLVIVVTAITVVDRLYMPRLGEKAPDPIQPFKIDGAEREP